MLVGVAVGVVGLGVGVVVSEGTTVALSTGLRLWLLLIAAESADMSIKTLVVAFSFISKWIIMSILSDGTFRLSVVPSL